MNKIYKIVWSKVKNTYVVVSEVAKSHSKAVSSRQRKSIAAVMTVLALGFIPGGAYAAIDGVKTFVEPGNQNVKIGNGIELRNNSVKNGAVAIGDHAEIDDYVMQEGSIAIGKNAFVENMWGFQDKTFRFGMVTPDGDERTDPYLPAGIAIGQNTYARSGGIMLGDHKYIGKLGDTTVDSTTAEKKRRLAVLVGATTLGLNSYSAGAFATTTGAYSIMSNAYDGNTNQGSGAQNFGAVINGSFNSIESKTSGNSSSGIANAIVGTANRTFNANGALVFGAGNEITNSVENISLPTLFPNDAKALADGLRSTVRGNNGDGTSGGAVLAIGGGNLSDYSSRSQLSGVGNTLKGSAAKIASYNFLNGYRNTGINTSYSTLIGTKNTVSEGIHNIIVGDNHKLSDASHNVVLGSADTELETKVSDAVILGHNANTTIASGVALGSRSVADRGKADREQVYLHENDDVKATVKGDLAAISVGNDKATRQITGVAAGTADTDAVNVAQLKAMTGGGSATSVHFFSVKGSKSSQNYMNDGAKDSGAIAIGANAAAEKSGSVAMGFNTTAGGSGSIAIGESAQILANEENRGDGKGVGTIIIGNESADAGGTKDHAASNDTLIGSLNSVGESNGVFVRGTGNIVTNAYHYEDLTEEDMQKFMDFYMQGKPAGEYFEKTGSHISVNGDGNYVDNALYSQISGVNNKLTGTDTLPAEYNIITGNRNTLENASNNIVTGDKYKLAGVKHAVIIGSSDEEKEVKVSDIVMVGHNANATVAGGVALGSGSVADRAGFTEKKEGVFSDVDLNGITAAAVSVGTKDKLRQIINVGDATEDTDAVNLRQLKALKTKVDNSAIHYFSVKADDSKKPAGTNWNNDGATSDNAVAIGRGASATSFSSVAIGDGAAVTSDTNLSGGVAIGKKSNVINGNGRQEKYLGFGTLKDPQRSATGIAIGAYSFARTGSIQIGAHTYLGKMGGIDITDGTNGEANHVNQTTVGTNTFNKGVFGTMVGAYSISTGDFPTSSTYAAQNFGSTVAGSLNTIQSKGHGISAGISNSIVGLANVTENTNGTLIFGTGNKVTNSLKDLGLLGALSLTNGAATPDEMIEKLRKMTINNESGGSTMVVGGGNTADYTMASQIMGVNNTLTGTKDKVSAYNLVDGFKNKAENVTHVTMVGSDNAVKDTTGAVLLGDKRKLTGADGSIVLGSADESAETKVKDATVIGHNANTTVASGVALGSGSVANREKADAEKVYLHEDADVKATVKGDLAAVSVGNDKATRQITGVAAGTEDTDAVNVAQLKAAAKDIAGSITDTKLKADTNALSLDGTKLNLSVEDTAGNKVTGSVDLKDFKGAVSTTYTLEGKEDKEKNTTTISLKGSDGKEQKVTVATKDTRNTIVESDTVAVEATEQEDKSVEYKLNVKTDGKVEKDNKGIVTGGTVYNETRIEKDGKYIKVENTAGQNLTALDKQVDANTTNITKLGDSIDAMGDRVNRVGAGAAALAALHPLDFDPDDKWDFAAGYGNYKGANAAAIGAYYRPNEDTMFSVGGSFGGGENMVNAGVSVKLGQGNHVSTSKVAMAKDMLAMQKRMAEMEAQMAKMQGFIGALTGMDTQAAMFPDVPENHWAYEYIKGLCEQGIIEGYPDGTFGGNRSMTRYEFAAMLYRALAKGVSLDARAVKEFAPELGRIRVDVISQNKEGQPVIERVRVNEEKKEK